MSGRRSPRIVCLLPARNAASEIGAWLDSASAVADAVVALDDGSTDDTGAVLAAHPIVAKVLSNPRRVGHLGWHDGRNRNRLLAAAASLAPDWILSLDADERIDADDGEALRRFVADDALPGCAYGFQVYRMQADDTYDPRYEWVYRLFAYREGQQFLNRRIDLVPVPKSIGPQRWVRTTLRIKHYGEVGEVGRVQRVDKYRETDPEGVFRDYYEHLQEPSRGPYPRWRPRESTTPVLLAAASPASGNERPYVVCLLPARDCAALLPRWFESIAHVADAVIALDDGSVDDTGRILRAHPLVVRVLTNAPRDGFGGWNDGENRNRLLAAAAELSPQWIISVDADERIPLEDAVALRRFLHHGAQPGHAYALASYRMIGDEDHYDRLDYDAYRLFAWEPGQRFPDDHLHAPPVPTSITEWRQTTIRMKHLVSLTETHRRARRTKFAQADPDFAWEPDYDYTIDPPGAIKQWEPRPLDRPVLVHPEPTEPTLDNLDLDGPALSVVVVVCPGEERKAAWMLRGLAAENDGTVELLVATRDGYAAEVIERLVDQAVIVRIEAEWTDAGLRNVSMQAASGDYVAFVSPDDEVTFAGLIEVLSAHESGVGVVELPTAPSTRTAAGSAELLLAGAALDVVPASFVREPVLAFGGFDDNSIGGLDEGVRRTLVAKGFTTTTVDAITRAQPMPVSRGELLRRRYIAGRRGLADDIGAQFRGAWRRLPDGEHGVVGEIPIVAVMVVAGVTATWLGSLHQKVDLRRARRGSRP